MRAREFAHMVDEIERIPQGDFGDKDTLMAPDYKVRRKSLPGGSGYTYAVHEKAPGKLEIMIFDGHNIIAEIDLAKTQNPLQTWRVSTVAVDPDYRGKSLGKALYGIALSILKLTLEAGKTQTKHGQRMWLMLSSIPGVEVRGYDTVPTDQYTPRPGDEIISQNKKRTRFLFPVKASKHSMRSGRSGTGLYTSPSASMIARWQGT